MLCFAALIFFRPAQMFINKLQTKAYHYIAPKQEWMCVFVHGTFNFPLGMLNIYEVFQDNLDGTLYSKLIKRIRKDPFFYQEQPIQGLGLIPIMPTLIHDNSELKFAAYPIIKAYHEVLNSVVDESAHYSFYTFGWSGMLSQKQRRKAAVRFYNALVCEQKLLKAQYPNLKIRLITHSHGGNVCLNLALINEALRYSTLHSPQEINDAVRLEHSTDQENALLDMVIYLQSLPSREDAATKKGQKKFDYCPAEPSLYIDEFIGLGIPVQAETTHCFYNPTFGKCFHFYSDQDTIQGSDFVSTKRYVGSKRLDHAETKHTATVVQARIMVDHDWRAHEESQAVDSYISWLWNLCSKSSSTSIEKKDPSHKDLWFLGWNKDYCQLNFPLHPLPVVIIVPWLVASLTHAADLNDADLNISLSNTILSIKVAAHNEKDVRTEQLFSSIFLNDLTSKIQAWKPDNLSKEKIFATMNAKL